MQSLLYIGHSYHTKTKSTQFLQDILKTKYEVTAFDYDPYNDTEEVFSQFKEVSFDVVLLFQIMPKMKLLRKKLGFKRIVFFPMFDGIPAFEDAKWFEYRNCIIINFSKALHEQLISRGYSSHYIQYFPKPMEVTNWGEKKSLFFWQRTSDITIKTIEKLFEPEQISHLHFHQAIDPCHEIIKPSCDWVDKVTYSSWYDKREEMLQDMQKSALYMAPRKHEGIGQSFLEAMAMGRCVIAPNNPTMNEYIEHGKTGLLYELDKEDKLIIEDTESIQKTTFEYITKGYNKWEIEKRSILDWLEERPNTKKILFSKYFLKTILMTFLKFCMHLETNTEFIRVKVLGLRVLKRRKAD